MNCFPDVIEKIALPLTLGNRIGGLGKTLGSVRSMAGIGAGIGAAKGLIAPGTEYDANGNPHQKSRIGAMLGGAGTGALVGGGIGLGAKTLGAPKAMRGLGRSVDNGRTRVPDFMHDMHEGVGGARSFNRGQEMAARPKTAAPANIPVTPTTLRVTQPNGVTFHFEHHHTNPATGEIHGFHLDPHTGTKTQASFIAAHAKAITPIHHEPIEAPKEQMSNPSISGARTAFGKAAALRLVRNDMYLVADTNGDGFVGTYKGASADDRAVFLIHAPGVESMEAAFDMRKLAHISPVINTKTGSVAKTRDELAFTDEGQKLAEAYAFKQAKRVSHPSFAAHQFKKKDAAPVAEPAASATLANDTIGATSPLPMVRAKAKK